MSSPSFWSGPEGRLLARRQRFTRVLRIELSGEPWCKGEDPFGEQERAVRSQVADELAEFRRGTLTGPVAVSLWFTSARRESVPPVEDFCKALLDALRRSDRSGETARGPVLLRDDVQVRFLHAHLSHRPGSAATTRVQVQPLRDVAEEFRVAHEVLLDHDDQLMPTSESNPFALSGYGWDEQVNADVGLPEELAERLRVLARAEQHRALLGDMDRHLLTQLVGQPFRIFGVHRRERERQLEEAMGIGIGGRSLSEESWEMVTERLALVLPAPTGPGRSARDFRAELAATLVAAGRRCPLVPLLPEARVTLLVVPHHRQTHRDLDNLARQVLPAARAHLLETFSAEPDRDRTGVASGLREFQAIVLHRRDADPAAGVLRLLPGLERTAPDWERVTRFVDEVTRLGRDL